MTVTEIRRAMREQADPERAQTLRRFFKTGPGDYGEGDVFIGLTVPQVRQFSRQFHDAPLPVIRRLLASAVHEDRLLALLTLVARFRAVPPAGQKRIYELYLAHTDRVNNWDLVDLSAEHIVGAYLFDRDRSRLDELAVSPWLWDRRIAIVATFYFVHRDHYADTLRIAERLLGDREDLIHKAVGWLLREVGKGDLQAEESFLQTHYRRMPRTMLRYAIERFPEPRRQAYLKGTA